MSEELIFKGNDGKDIHAYCWKDVKQPLAVVQIFHGMAEHALRYANFAGFLNEKGLIVYADDHRGHGRTAGIVENVGYIGSDGFNRIVEDEHILTGLIKQEHKGLKIFVLGHSFGSFIAQEYITRYGNDISGVILSGSAKKGGPDVRFGAFLAAIMKLSGENKKNYILDKLSFGSYNKRVKNPKSKFDWLSRDEEIVRIFEEDPFCGTVFTTNFYYYFFKGLAALYKKQKTARIPKNLPVLIASGDCDPVGSYASSPKKLYSLYKGFGIEKASLKLYTGGRHEMLNEINREEVYEDFFNWIHTYI